jgi:hypothetical protein
VEEPRGRQITDLLRELTQEHARPGFTVRVLAQLDAKPRRAARWSFRPATALAAITVMVVAISAGALIEWRGGARKHREAAQARQTLQELRAEHGRLEQELRAMSPPIIYLGSDEKVDYVLDLDKVHAAGVVATAAPAAYHDDTF